MLQRTCLLIAWMSCCGLATAADPLEALVRERIMTAPADRAKQQTYPQGAVAVGDLFRCRRPAAVAVAVVDGRSTGLACLVHKDGDWREIARLSLGTPEQPFLGGDAQPFTFADLDGDQRPELLVTEQGGDGDRSVSVFRFDPMGDHLTAVGSGLRNPEWRDGAVLGRWKSGPTSGDVGAEEHRWTDGALRRTWRSVQLHPMHEYLIGSGEPAVRVAFERRDAANALVASSAVGNIASFASGLPAGESPRVMRALVTSPRGRNLVVISPRTAALDQARLGQRWDEIVSRALFSDGELSLSGRSVVLGDGATVPLDQVAESAVTPVTLGPTYQFFSIDDELRRTITEPKLPALGIGSAAGVDWTRGDRAVVAWGAICAAAPAPTIPAGEDVLVYLRLPNLAGYPVDQIENGTLVSGLTLDQRAVAITASIDAGQRPSLAPKDVARPLVVVSLGRPGKGLHRVKATIAGYPEASPMTVEASFTVP
jgi:hypothetical protein